LIQLDAGKLLGQEGRLFSEAAHEEMWRPMIPQPVTPRPEALKLTQALFNSYALGWDVRDYRGAKSCGTAARCSSICVVVLFWDTWSAAFD
jgi:hypothetical protein